jgi:thioester reductase-like protein
MKAEKAIFVTGATGLVGGFWTLTALRAGHSVRLLVRGKQNRSPQERIQQVLGLFGFSPEEWSQFHSRIEIYEGDIALPQFGLSDRDWQRLAHELSCIYHAAAYLSFKMGQRAKSILANVEGTRNILRLAETSRAHLFYVSTAYLSGETTGRIREQKLKGPSTWRNPYEETKFIAEREVHSTCQEKKLSYTVFRPAILIGDSVSGRTIRFNSIYYFMKLFYQYSQQERPSFIVLEAKPEATLNLLPVDVAIRAMWALSQSPRSLGKIFHITHPSPLTFRQLISMAERIFGLSIQISGSSHVQPGRRGADGEETETALSLYAPYMFGEPEFDLTNTSSVLPDYPATFPEMDETYFRRILAFAIEQEWGAHFLPETGPRGERGPSDFIERYFEEFLMAKLDQPLVINLKNLSAVFSIHIQDGVDSHWVLEIKQGKLLSISPDSAMAECSYWMDPATFEKIVRGVYRPEEAFFDGRINIQGNMEKGLRVAAALAEFCKTYPYGEKKGLP